MYGRVPSRVFCRRPILCVQGGDPAPHKPNSWPAGRGPHPYKLIIKYLCCPASQLLQATWVPQLLQPFMHLHPPSSSASARPPPCPPRALVRRSSRVPQCPQSTRARSRREQGHAGHVPDVRVPPDPRKERSIVELPIERRERRALAQPAFERGAQCSHRSLERCHPPAS